MRKADRLFDLLQALRDGRLHRGRDLAARLGVSLRTVYRDLDALVAAGVPVTGERGVGFLLTGPVFLPPLTLTPQELEALELGIALVRASVGGDLGAAAGVLGDKVRAVLPSARLLDPDRTAIAVPGAPWSPATEGTLGALRQAVLTRRVVRLRYLSLGGETTEREVRPLEIELWRAAFTLTAWCELRADFRVFRLDRVEGLTVLDRGFRPEPGRRRQDYLRRLRGEAAGPQAD